jgi:hypothetical protein
MTKGKKEGEGGCLIRVFRITKNTTEKVATWALGYSILYAYQHKK